MDIKLRKKAEEIQESRQSGTVKTKKSGTYRFKYITGIREGLAEGKFQVRVVLENGRPKTFRNTNIEDIIADVQKP